MLTLVFFFGAGLIACFFFIHKTTKRLGGGGEMDKQMERVLRIKDPLMRRMYAGNEILKRYYFSKESEFDLSVAIDALAAIISKETDKYQKKAGRFILNFFYGIQETNNMIEDHAIVTEREDPLVRRWKKKVLDRDDYTCQHCGSREKLVVHHISHWSDDPVNRINVDNGITLCPSCHSKEHIGDWYSNFVDASDTS